MMEEVEEVRKPEPFSEMNFALELAAAMTEGSSTHMGIVKYLPFMRKFKLNLFKKIDKYEYAFLVEKRIFFGVLCYFC